ncbi:MAG: LysE family translocator [Bacteroidaceae bacterium]|nr:LysE family translocator [Bacteroidaceae bacterium]
MFGIISINILLKGLIIGFIAAAPTGPSGVLVIERTLDKGRWYGFFTGLGISVSDAIYIVCSSVGLAFLMDMINDHRTSAIFGMIGCCLLLAFGIFTIRNNPLKKLRSPQQTAGSSLPYASLSGFLVAIVNPMVIAIYMTLFAYLHLALGELEPGLRIQGYISAYIGDVLWWFFISSLIDKLRNRFDLKGIWVINRILGSVLILVAVIWFVYMLCVY